MPSEHLETQMKFQEGKPLSADFATLLALLKSRGIVGPHDAPTTASELAVVIRMRPKPTARPAEVPVEEAADLSPAAVHESGHACVYLALEVPGTLEYVSVGKRKSSRSLGRTYFHREGRGDKEGDRLEKIAIAGGSVAEIQILGSKLEGGDVSDRKAIDALGGLDDDDDEHTHLVVAELRTQITTLARELDRRGTLTGAQVAQCFRGIPRDKEDEDDEEDDQNGEACYSFRDGDFDSDLPYTSR